MRAFTMMLLFLCSRDKEEMWAPLVAPPWHAKAAVAWTLAWCLDSEFQHVDPPFQMIQLNIDIEGLQLG
jgi:hypothetical protein